MKETLARILEIEETASQLHAEAEREAANILVAAERASMAFRRRVLDAAQAEADERLARAREAVEADRAQVLAEAGASAQHLETLTHRHGAQAIAFILDAVIEPAI